MPRYPDIEPYETGLLDTGDGNLVYWEACGNPDGVPALIVHGGPGSGCAAGTRRSFDPEKFRIILFDQRNCGRSLPRASDPAADMSLNTTEHLLRDMEQLREHLGVGTWLLRGGSWGVTLSLAYAERHPGRVSGMLMLSVTSTRRLELDWLYRGVGRFFPEAWARFRDFAGLADSYRLPTDSTPPISGLLQAYSRMMEDPDIRVRSRAATEWMAWEDAVISQESSGSPGAYGDRPYDAKLAFVRICSHYFAHDGFLEDGVLIREARRRRPPLRANYEPRLATRRQVNSIRIPAGPGVDATPRDARAHTGDQHHRPRYAAIDLELLRTGATLRSPSVSHKYSAGAEWIAAELRSVVSAGYRRAIRVCRSDRPEPVPSGVLRGRSATSGYHPGSRRHVDRGPGAALAPYRPSVVRGSRPRKAARRSQSSAPGAGQTSAPNGAPGSTMLRY